MLIIPYILLKAFSVPVWMVQGVGVYHLHPRNYQLKIIKDNISECKKIISNLSNKR